MDDDFRERAGDRHDAFRRDWETAPSPAVVLAAVEQFKEALPAPIGDWPLLSAYESPRHLVALLTRPHKAGRMHCEWIFERKEGQWRCRGGSGGSGARALDRRPGPNERPLLWLGLTTIFCRGEWTDTIPVTGGLARSDVAKVVVQVGEHSSEIQVDDRGWFYIILEGEEAATLTAREQAGREIVDHDGLPVACRLESLRK